MQLFSAWPSLRALDWASMRKKTAIEPLVAAVQSLPPEDRRTINLLLRRCLALRTTPGLKVILEELNARYPERVDEWASLHGGLDRVVWTYLNAPDAFEEAAVFARADSLASTRYGRRWTGVPYDSFDAGLERRTALIEALIAMHKEQLRGENCHVNHYRRSGGTEYFFAYLPNWPENFDVFNHNGQLEHIDLATAFSILFVFEKSGGALEIVAQADHATLVALRRAFYAAITNTDVPDADPDKPAFALDHLLTDGFTFAAPGVADLDSATVERLLVFPVLDGHEVQGLQLRIKRGTPWASTLQRLDAMLASNGLTRNQVTIGEVRVRLTLVAHGNKRARSFLINITPKASDLKSQDDDDLRALGDRCLRLWEIIDA